MLDQRDVGDHLLICELVRLRNLHGAVQEQHAAVPFRFDDQDILELTPDMSQLPADGKALRPTGIERSQPAKSELAAPLFVQVDPVGQERILQHRDRSSCGLQSPHMKMSTAANSRSGRCGWRYGSPPARPRRTPRHWARNGGNGLCRIVAPARIAAARRPCRYAPDLPGSWHPKGPREGACRQTSCRPSRRNSPSDPLPRRQEEVRSSSGSRSEVPRPSPVEQVRSSRTPKPADSLLDGYRPLGQGGGR